MSESSLSSAIVLRWRGFTFGRCAVAFASSEDDDEADRPRGLALFFPDVGVVVTGGGLVELFAAVGVRNGLGDEGTTG